MAVVTERVPDDDQVRAAGGLPWRVTDQVVEVLLVHRPKYDDWTFPKGKLEAGESFEDAARREVEEETGLRGVLGRELPPSEYVDGKGRPKIVRYWEMTVSDGTFVANDEVDQVRWVPVDEADLLLTYPRDHEVLECFRVFAGVTPAP